MILFVGSAVRLVIAPFFAHPFDVYSWYVNGENFLNGTSSVWTFLVPYRYSFFLFVFPATYVFGLISPYLGMSPIPISSLDPRLNPGSPWNITLIPGPFFNLLLKLPLIASDVLIAFLVYKLVAEQNGDRNLAVAAAGFWFWNPLVVWVSSGWGTFDSLPAMFAVLALYLVLKRRFTSSGVALTLGIAMKYYPIIMVIPLLLIAKKVGGSRAVLACGMSTLVTSAVLFFPFIEQVVQGYVSLATAAVPSVPYYSGLSFWTSITLVWPISLQSELASVMIVAFSIGMYVLIRNIDKVDLRASTSYFAVSVVPLLLFFRYIGENFFVWLLPFASILVTERGRGKILVMSLSIVAVLSSVTDSLLPYYMLPMAPWIGGILVDALSVVSPYRVGYAGSVSTTFGIGKVVLSVLGILASLMLLALWVSWIRDMRHKTSASSGRGDIYSFVTGRVRRIRHGGAQT